MTTTTQLITILTIMLTINIGMAMFQEGMQEVNPLGSTFFDVAASPYSNYASDGSLLVGTEYLPSGLDVEAETSGNIFTDTFNTFSSWLSDKLKPLSFLTDILQQPFKLLVTGGVPVEICIFFAVLWYCFALLIIVSWLGGR